MTKKIVEITWLEPCRNCNSNVLYVNTSRTDGFLDELDDVSCPCGEIGYIDVYDGNAFICWGEE